MNPIVIDPWWMWILVALWVASLAMYRLAGSRDWKGVAVLLVALNTGLIALTLAGDPRLALDSNLAAPSITVLDWVRRGLSLTMVGLAIMTVLSNRREWGALGLATMSLAGAVLFASQLQWGIASGAIAVLLFSLWDARPADSQQSAPEPAERPAFSEHASEIAAMGLAAAVVVVFGVVLLGVWRQSWSHDSMTHLSNRKIPVVPQAARIKRIIEAARSPEKPAPFDWNAVRINLPLVAVPALLLAMSRPRGDTVSQSAKSVSEGEAARG